jgi:hypothetical protein
MQSLREDVLAEAHTYTDIITQDLRAKIDGQFDNRDNQFKVLMESLSTTRKMLHDTPQCMALPPAPSTKTLKLIVSKNYISLATPSTLNLLKLKAFSILPKNTKKEVKSSKKHIIYAIQTNILPLIIAITRSNKVFSILPNNKEKNTQKPKNITKNKITQNRTKKFPKKRSKTPRI